VWSRGNILRGLHEDIWVSPELQERTKVPPEKSLTAAAGGHKITGGIALGSDLFKVWPLPQVSKLTRFFQKGR